MAQGFTVLEAYSPVPIEELNDIIHKKRTILPRLVLAGGLTGMATGFALQYWASVIEFPMNVGGRPLASWTTFIVPSYELTILFAALTAAIAMIVLCGLPPPYHPVFNVDALLDGQLRQVLPRHRDGGSEIRPATRPPSSCGAWAGRREFTTLWNESPEDTEVRAGYETRRECAFCRS